MSASIHDLTPEELETLGTKAIEAKATAYCKVLYSMAPHRSFVLAIVRKLCHSIFVLSRVCNMSGP